jgi:gamma-glutamyltranspeptidase/glutathione hydrolase
LNGTDQSQMFFPKPRRRTLRPNVMGRNGMVAAGHYLAAWWGTEILRRGGNAADAVVAAGLVINVVHNDNACFSGVAPIMFFDRRSGQVHSISGVGRWPGTTNTDSCGQIVSVAP